MASSYGGNLRSFLLTPQLSDPIESVKDMVLSTIPWKVTMYGDESQSWNEDHPNPYARVYWADKIELKYQEFPFEVVSAHLILFKCVIHVLLHCR